MASNFSYEEEDEENNVTDFDKEPLDRLTIEVLKNGIKKSVAALHRGWVEKVVYINYSPPENPDKNAAHFSAEDLAVANEEWMDKMNFLKDDLELLLKLPHHRFWSQAVYDHELRQCLSSFLSHCPRYFDLPNPHLTSDMKKLLEDLARSVFFVHLRMATYKENKSCHITPRFFGEIIYENYLFDIPKLMDLCVIYSKGNCTLLQKIIENIFKYQPKYYDDLSSVVPSIKQALDNVKATIGLHESYATDPQIQNGHFTSQLREIPWVQLQDVIYFLVDICATLSAFLEVYHLASSVFNEHDFPNFLASYYDLTIPLIQKELRLRIKDKNLTSLIAPVKKRLNLAKGCCIKIIRTIITVSYIEPILDSSDKEIKMEYIDGFLDFMITRLSDSYFMADYVNKYPIEDDLDMIAQIGTFHDQMKVDYLIQGVRLLETVKSKKKEPSVERKENYADHSLKESETEQMNGLFSEGACASEAICGVELESLITQVKDLLPDLGDGFIHACLEYYNYAVEDVIHFLLDDSLPPVLKKLDRKMPMKEKTKDNGNMAAKENFDLLSERRNVYDNDEFDVFNRVDVDMSRIHKGKREDIKSQKDVLDDKTELSGMKQWYKNYQDIVEVVDVANDDLYNDEYDDTYDENDVGALIEHDRTPDELLQRRPFVTPRVLRTTDEREASESDEEDVEREKAKAEAMRKDHFIENPEEVRRRNAERWASKQAARGRPYKTFTNTNRDVKGNSKGQGQSEEVKRNRAFKERNKSSRGDHGRKFFSDRKRSGGMMPR